jgi:chromosome segregation ATPase
VSRFEESSKTNWPLLALGAGLIPLMVGGMGYLMASYTANAVAPLQTQIVQIETGLKTAADQIKEVATIQAGRGKDLSLLGQTATTNSELLNRMIARQHDLEEKVAASTAADVNSRTDREQLNQRVAKLEQDFAKEMAERRANSAEVRIQLAEVEQQFHSVSNLENLRAAQQERLNAMLWEKSHPGERYPNGTFFPTSIFQGTGGAAPMISSAPAP